MPEQSSTSFGNLGPNTYGASCLKHGVPACAECRVAKAFGPGLSDDGELATWHDHSWVVADARNDGTHVHLTLTYPAKEG